MQRFSWLDGVGADCHFRRLGVGLLIESASLCLLGWMSFGHLYSICISTTCRYPPLINYFLCYNLKAFKAYDELAWPFDVSCLLGWAGRSLTCQI